MAASRFHTHLRVKIEAVIAEHMGSLCSGQVPDYAAYRDNVGYIRGLNDALRLCEDIERDMNQ